MLTPIEMKVQESAPIHATPELFEGMNPFAVKINTSAPIKEHKKIKKNFLRLIDFQIFAEVFSNPSSIAEVIKRSEKRKK